MRILIVTLVHFISFSSLSQEIKTQYFFVNENDSLIRKQINAKKNMPEVYTIINDEKVVKEYISSFGIDSDDYEIDSFDSISFTFIRDNDTIVNDSFIKNINIIETRKEFFKRNIDFDETKTRFVFIIPIKCNKFIVRKVKPVVSE